MRKRSKFSELPYKSELVPPFLKGDETRQLAAAMSKFDAEERYRDSLTDIWNVAFPAGVVKGHEEGWKKSAKINEQAGFGQGFSTAAKLFMGDVEHIIIDRRNPDPNSFLTGKNTSEIKRAVLKKMVTDPTEKDRYTLFVPNRKSAAGSKAYHHDFTATQLYKKTKFSVIENGDLLLVNKTQLYNQGHSGAELTYGRILKGEEGTSNESMYKIWNWGGKKAKEAGWGTPPTTEQFLDSIYKPPKQGAYSKPGKKVGQWTNAGLLEYKKQPNNLFT